MSASSRLSTAASSAGILGPLNLLRDSFTLPTLLFMGASLQAILTFLPISPIHQVLPALSFVLYKMIDTALIALRYKTNSQLASVKPGKFAATLSGDVNGDGGLSVFIIGMQVNHPLGALAPGVLKASDYFQRMVKQLEAESEDYGLIGNTSGLQAERASRNAILAFMYFKSHDAVLRYARSPLHAEAVAWYNQVAKENPHLGVFHETYNVSPGNFEALYLNMTDFGLGSSTYLAKDKAGNEIRQSTIVDARKGIYSTAEGRMTGKAVDNNGA